MQATFLEMLEEAAPARLVLFGAFADAKNFSISFTVNPDAAKIARRPGEGRRAHGHTVEPLNEPGGDFRCNPGLASRIEISTGLPILIGPVTSAREIGRIADSCLFTTLGSTGVPIQFPP